MVKETNSRGREDGDSRIVISIGEISLLTVFQDSAIKLDRRILPANNI
jgi:hypothetical protein